MQLWTRDRQRRLHDKRRALLGQKLMVVQPIDKHGRGKGRSIVALDSVGAGVGETIYWCRGKEASFSFFAG